MKILVYPGTFDPIACNHVDTLRAAMREKDYDRIYILLQTNRFKGGAMFTYEARLKFVQAALVENDMSKVRIITTTSPYFFDALEMNGIIQVAFSGENLIDVLIGDDSLSSIEEWAHFNLLKKYCKFIIVQRMFGVEYIWSTAARMFDRFYVISTPNKISSKTSSTEVRAVISDVLKAWRRSNTTLS